MSDSKDATHFRQQITKTKLGRWSECEIYKLAIASVMVNSICQHGGWFGWS